jgi:ribosomal protein S18 acetylase RimI-like enzyme
VVAARDASGRVAAFARAVSDGKCAWIYDVIVADGLRGSQLGSAIMEVLLDHPSVRHVRHVRLTTRDAMPFYRRLGFRDLAEAPRYPWTSTEMIRPGIAAGVATASAAQNAAERPSPVVPLPSSG